LRLPEFEMTTRSSSPWPSHYTNYAMPALTSTYELSVMPLISNKIGNGKVIPLEARCGPEGG